MKNYFEIVECFNRVYEEIKNLEKEYEGKVKGDVYRKRKLNLINKQKYFHIQAKVYGTKGTICHIRGKRSRASLKNPAILVNEGFNLYFINVTEKEAVSLLNLHVKNVVSYKITFYKPGVILTSS